MFAIQLLEHFTKSPLDNLFTFYWSSTNIGDLSTCSDSCTHDLRCVQGHRLTLYRRPWKFTSSQLTSILYNIQETFYISF